MVHITTASCYPSTSLTFRVALIPACGQEIGSLCGSLPRCRGMADLAAAQLQAELQAAVLQSLCAKRPLLTHLNGDTSWLLQLPLSDGSSSRFHYNILFDPVRALPHLSTENWADLKSQWFTGPQSDVASWFSTQFHTVQPSIKSVSELEQNLKHKDFARHRSTGTPWKKGKSLPESFIDAVVISHEFTDHCHRATL